MEFLTQQTICSAASGEISAFEEIYRKTSGYVYAIALRTTNNQDDAQDITQEVFMIVHRKLGTYNFKAAFKTWLYRITVNASIDHCRRRKKVNYIKKKWRNEYAKVDMLHKDSNSPGKENAEQYLQYLFAKLDPEQRSCLLLREVEGMSYKDMAKTLNINLNTLRTKLRRARQALLKLGKGELNYEM